MSDDLQFGELETKEPERGLRPDRNRHYAVVPYGNPAERELPIYIDLDVMNDIEVHAKSDTTVELGGVLLGGQHHDEDGRPFVVITDSLRAEHYESTKGSFKFTHETWSAISRQREEFPPDCQMVGWYHTHPDWGVFLSGMDMFICDNFFNKLLDVAYVVDPCRGDRGMFEWIAGPRQTTRRTGGFYVIASRFRQTELESYVAALEEGDAMPSLNEPRGNSQTVVHLHGQQPTWMGPAVMGMLCLQFALVALLAFKLIGSTEDQGSEKLMAKLLEQRAAEVKAETQKKVLDRVLMEIKGTEPGTVSIVEEQTNEIRKLKDDVRDLKELAGARANQLAETAATLETERKKAEDHALRLKKKIEETEKHRDFHMEKASTLEAELKEKLAELAESGKGSNIPQLYWIIGGGIAVLVAAGAAAAIIRKSQADEAAADEELPAELNDVPPSPAPLSAGAGKAVGGTPAVEAPRPSPGSSTSVK